ncbi:DUF1259 domain-containing protein [Pedobacter sp. CG_S7]|uniref:DUF1259 domain-containing protein n=1 Tax=Pedobacter sp. CG_S7 TaxID=3143930 RepID=UPI0033919F35
MLQHEVNDVIQVLRKNNLEVVAVNNHMLGDDPHMIFLHPQAAHQKRKLLYIANPHAWRELHQQANFFSTHK